jgi:hypothetical protein
MAKVRSHMFSAMFGSIGHTTYSSDHGCSIIARKKPNLPPGYIPTPYQTAIQDFLRAACDDFKLLSQESISAWRHYAVSTPYPNSIGDLVRLSPQNAYIRSRVAIAVFDHAVPSEVCEFPPDPPGFFLMPKFTDNTVLGSGKVNLDFFNLSTTSRMGLSIWVSLPQNLTRFYFGGPYDLTLFSTIPEIAPDSVLAWELKGLTKNKRYFFRVRAFALDDSYRISRYRVFHCDC